MTNVKEVWDNSDYPIMGWHDCRIYSIEFPLASDEFKLQFDLDYIFNISKSEGNMTFMIAPCVLTFEGVVNLSLDLDFGRRTDLDILHLERKECERLKEANVKYWTYVIETRVGDITFDAFNYRQVVKKEPVWTDNIDLEHERTKP
jgi:hypothetical protein